MTHCTCCRCTAALAPVVDPEDPPSQSRHGQWHIRDWVHTDETAGHSPLECAACCEASDARLAKPAVQAENAGSIIAPHARERPADVQRRDVSKLLTRTHGRSVSITCAPSAAASRPSSPHPAPSSSTSLPCRRARWARRSLLLAQTCTGRLPLPGRTADGGRGTYAWQTCRECGMLEARSAPTIGFTELPAHIATEEVCKLGMLQPGAQALQRQLTCCKAGLMIRS